MVDKSISFTDRSNKTGENNLTKGNVTYTEEDEEDMKEVMKMMNDQIVSKSKENLVMREEHQKEIKKLKSSNKKENEKYLRQIEDSKV